jgi:hypothetical protein
VERGASGRRASPNLDPPRARALEQSIPELDPVSPGTADRRLTARLDRRRRGGDGGAGGRSHVIVDGCAASALFFSAVARASLLSASVLCADVSPRHEG